MLADLGFRFFLCLVHVFTLCFRFWKLCCEEVLAFIWKTFGANEVVGSVCRFLNGTSQRSKDGRRRGHSLRPPSLSGGVSCSIDGVSLCSMSRLPF
ncbi:hypothetical protein EUGRSUZ_D01433 [Eucalyptus grandis]|uniref:Uncharacterized protein n=2 Tax=Eucalyptus grandis TaxID=71139 RepID=A0ACC3L6B2_EUCGR|nr:hypothetical protein EUGRSUZ_D01433 [Eucalyptus grandis]